MSVDFDFDGPPYDPPPGRSTDFEFEPPYPCNPDWKEVAGNNLVVDVNVRRDWKDQRGDSLVLSADCPDTEVCFQDWYPRRGDELVVDFQCCGTDCTGNWIVQDSLNLVVDFQCCNSSATSPEIVLDLITASNGSSVSVSLDTVRLIPTTAYSGEQFTPSLSVSVVLGAVPVSTSESVTTSLTVPPPVLLTPVAIAGEALITELSASRVLSFSTSHGETSSVSLDTRPAANFVASAETGESLSSTLVTIHSVEHDFPSGESLAVSLTTIGATNLVVTASQGEALTGTLVTLSTLEPVFQVGESIAAGIEWHSASYPAWNQSSGESSTATLATSYLLSRDSSVGESISASLTLPVREDVGLEFGSGSHFSIGTLSTGSSLGTVAFYQGSTVLVESVDEVSNYRAATGASFEISFQPTTSFPNTSEDGQRLAVSLDTRPPAAMSANFFEGSWFDAVSMNTLVSAPLRVAFCEGVFIEVSESASTTSYDLEGPPTYPNRLQWWVEMNQFEFIDMPPSFVYGSGAGVVVTADLQTRPRFSISFATGETFTTVRGYDYMDVDLAQGLASQSMEFMYIEPTINLCTPNVFPDADSMEVELEFNEEACYADFLYEGQSISSALSCIYTVAPVWWHEGTGLQADLTIYDLWRIYLAHGEMLICYLGTSPILPISLHAGETVKGTFQEPTAECFTGESVELSLTITFEVEFLERGCLDNEYRYMNENGDEDKSRFNPVAVELEPFSHEIKARCF